MGKRKGGKQMRRRIDKNKVYAFVGRAVTYLALYTLAEIGFLYAICNCITVYR